jgi:hypothetical protein
MPSKIKKTIDAISFVAAAYRSHVEAWRMAHKTEGYLIRMDSPFDQKYLKEKQIDWASNWNFGKGNSQCNQIIIRNTSEINSAISLMDVELERFDKKKHKDKVFSFLQSEELRQEVADRIASNLVEVIERDQRVDTFIRRAEYTSTLFGFCACIDDDYDYLPAPIDYNKIAFEDYTPVDNPKNFVVFQNVKGEFLWSLANKLIKRSSEPMYSLPEEPDVTFDSSGYNVSALVDLICQIYSTKNEAKEALKKAKGIPDKDAKFITWEDVQLLADTKGEVWCEVNLENVVIAKIYELDYDGFFYETYLPVTTPKIENPDWDSISHRTDVLYFRRKKMNSDEFIDIIRDMTVDGSEYIHDIRGNGKLIAEYALRYDIKRNSIEDKLLLNGNIWLRSPNGIIEKNVGVKVLGGLNILGEDTDLVERQINTDLSAHINSLGLENSEYADVVSHIKPQTKLSNRPTKDEVNFISNEVMSQRASDIPHKLKAYSNIFTKVIRNLSSKQFKEPNSIKIQERFFDLLIEEFRDFDLSREDLIKVLSTVSAVRILPVMSDKEALQIAIQNATSSSSRRRLVRMFLASFGFTRKQIREITSTEQFGRDAELAALENVAFYETQEVVFSNGQDHIIHLNSHFYKMDFNLSGVQQGQDPVKAFNFVRNALPNCQLHLMSIKDNYFYRNEYKDMEKMYLYFDKKLSELAQALDQMQKQAQKQAQDGQQNGQGGIPPEMQEKFRLDRIKLEEKLNTARIRTENAQALRQKQFEFDNELKKKKLEEEINNKKAIAQNQVELEQLKAAGKMAV